jgi:hypothetical protein
MTSELTNATIHALLHEWSRAEENEPDTKYQEIIHDEIVRRLNEAYLLGRREERNANRTNDTTR